MIAVIAGLFACCALLVTLIVKTQITASVIEMKSRHARLGIQTSGARTCIDMLWLQPGIRIVIAGLFALVLLLAGCPPLFAILAAGFAYATPSIQTARAKKNRINALQQQLPDVIQGLANTLSSGSSLMTALDLSCREGLTPSKEEFSTVLSELRMGTSLELAIAEFERRNACEAVTLLSTGILINKEVGGNLGAMLATLADTLRRKAEMEGKIKALTSQGRMQGWVMAGLPFLIAFAVYQLEPTAMAQLWTNPWGWLVLGIATVLLIVGGLIIRKIVTIDV